MQSHTTNFSFRQTVALWIAGKFLAPISDCWKISCGNFGLLENFLRQFRTAGKFLAPISDCWKISCELSGLKFSFWSNAKFRKVARFWQKNGMRQMTTRKIRVQFMLDISGGGGNGLNLNFTTIDIMLKKREQILKKVPKYGKNVLEMNFVSFVVDLFSGNLCLKRYVAKEFSDVISELEREIIHMSTRSKPYDKTLMQKNGSVLAKLYKFYYECYPKYKGNFAHRFYKIDDTCIFQYNNAARFSQNHQIYAPFSNREVLYNKLQHIGLSSDDMYKVISLTMTPTKPKYSNCLLFNCQKISFFSAKHNYSDVRFIESKKEIIDQEKNPAEKIEKLEKLQKERREVLVNIQISSLICLFMAMFSKIYDGSKTFNRYEMPDVRHVGIDEIKKFRLVEEIEILDDETCLAYIKERSGPIKMIEPQKSEIKKHMESIRQYNDIWLS